MALKVALPLSGLSENIYAHCALLSPLPQDFDEDENLELLVDPLNPFRSIDEGIGSSNENVNKKSPSEADDETPLTSSASSTSSPTPEVESKPPSPVLLNKVFDPKIKYQGRDILDLGRNLTDSTWKFQYAQLPDNNVSMFMANRSQYHRLGANGLNREYDLASCQKCTFQFPVNSPNTTISDDGATNANAKPIRSIEKAQNNLPSFKMYKHF